ncbi:beta-ketoacyl-[acyl-carrier-protein] synthase family protein [Streptomyces triticirhizae]|uniref:Beta-ketoacyl-[acyl-carrier-protein] synthase family protein n=1 Tax=Streptomyces triticirhizae TaxID=2483353 RepID=A0A3M2M745_9ACTN|nr:beta-ketoacyl-[acyl-carrier-protein] synthase family protein [Streptomyces triticirhizae]RMI44800.1 beta-ketoacyl-[acyl-carrier-protein] synthase family protein [Streptomyces triticirhizae]
MTVGNPPFHAAVTGLGLVTAAGVGTERSWETIVAARPTAAEIPAFDDLPVRFGCAATAFDGNAALGRRTAWSLDRCTQLALVAAREALAQAGLTPEDWDGSRVGVVLGTALGGMSTWDSEYAKLAAKGPRTVSPMLIPMAAVNMPAGQLASAFGARGPNFVTATACASGTTAIGTARELLRSGACDIVITGGTESALTRLVLTTFAKMGALSGRGEDPAGASRPFDADRDGFVLAEGAAVLVLERPEHAAARGARTLASVSGYGASADAGHATRPDPEGRGAEAALRTALADAGLSPDDIGHVNAHGTSTPLNDAVESRMISRVLGTGPAVTSVKGVTGHCLGASGAIEAAVGVLTLERQTVPPTANLERQDPDCPVDVVADKAREGRLDAMVSHSFGFGGQNAVLALTRP